MGYWDKVGNMKKLMLFAKDWRTVKEVKKEYNLTPAESWKLFRRVVRVYDEFECRDANNLLAGCPVKFKTTALALKKLELEDKLQK